MCGNPPSAIETSMGKSSSPLAHRRRIEKVHKNSLTTYAIILAIMHLQMGVMMRLGLGAALVTALMAVGCTNRAPVAPQLPKVPQTWIKAREIRPPQQNVHVGSLYYAREAVTPDFSQPVAIEPLCFTSLEKHGVELQAPNPVADFDLLGSLQASGGLSGIQTSLLKAGLSANLNDYYELKLTNVVKSSITHSDAQTVFTALRDTPKCNGWINNVDPLFAVYQVESAYSGDLVFSRKQTSGLDANATLTLKALQPKIEAALKNELRAGLSGKAMVFAIVPLPRNAQ